MRLAQQDAVRALDGDFGRMAVQVGRHAWGLEALTMREKAFVFLAADLCAHTVGFPLRTHVAMARSRGVSLGALREAVRHLAPDVGYPIAAEALMALAEIEHAEAEPQADADESFPDDAPFAADDGGHFGVDAATVAGLRELDRGFAEFVVGQVESRWQRPGMSRRERALCSVATDVCLGTLEDSFALHLGQARRGGADEEQIRAVVLLVAEFGIAKAWDAYRALDERPPRQAAAR